MKHILWVIFLCLCFVSCRNNNESVSISAEGQFVLNFEAQTSSTFFSVKTFGEIELIPLETTDNCLIGHSPEMFLDDAYFFIQDRQQQVIFRFDKEGKFINRIGRRGGGPGEYTEILDWDIEPKSTVVEILAPPNGQVMRYDFDGKFLSSQNFQIPTISFIKTGANYWINIGINNITGEERLLKLSEEGTVIEKFLPQKTNMLTTTEQNFTRCGDIISFKETFNHTVYRITAEGPIEKTTVDFGRYALPKNLHTMNMWTLLDELNTKGWANIYRFLENQQFIYIFFTIQQKGEPLVIWHWLVNKKTGNSVLQKLLRDDSLYEMMNEAKVLTEDNKLVFMANARLVKENTNPFFSNAENIKNSLSEESNPVIIILRINNF